MSFLLLIEYFSISKIFHYILSFIMIFYHIRYFSWFSISPYDFLRFSLRFFTINTILFPFSFFSPYSLTYSKSRSNDMLNITPSKDFHCSAQSWKSFSKSKWHKQIILSTSSAKQWKSQQKSLPTSGKLRLLFLRSCRLLPDVILAVHFAEKRNRNCLNAQYALCVYTIIDRANNGTLTE